ncbi:MAG: S9 family peptidase [Ferrimicrobium sp.]
MTTPRPLELADLWRRPLPGTAAVVQPRFDDDGLVLYYLFPDEGELLSLHRIDLATGEDYVLRGSDSAHSELGIAEELRRERLRLMWRGVTGFQVAGPRLLISENGVFSIIDANSGVTVGDYRTEGLLDCIAIAGSDEFIGTTGEELLVLSSKGERRVVARIEEPGCQIGVAEYVAQEELDRLGGIWVQGNGRKVAVSVIDERGVAEYPIVHLGTESPQLEVQRYPMVGAANARVRLLIIDLVSAESVPVALSFDDGYLADVAWTPNGDLIVTHLDRSQRVLWWELVDAATGLGRCLWEETGGPWVNLPDRIIGLRDGSILTTSEDDGDTRKLVCIESSGVRRWLSTEPAIVSSLYGVDAEERVAWVQASLGDVRERHLARVDLITGEMTVLTTTPGVHSGSFSPSGNSFVDSWSSREQPPTSRCVQGGAETVVVGSEASSALELDPPSFVEIEVANGERLFGAIYRPRSFEPRGPAVIAVYGGPHAQLVDESWSLTMDLGAQYLASRGVMVLKLDNRGSYGRGRRFEAEISYRFGTVELEDQLCGVRYLVDNEGVDPARVGIYGWSYGGFMTLTALAKAPEVFAVGVAGAPVVDFRWYDTAYTERYMGTPEDNPAGYEESSILTHLANVRSPLAVIHGAVDENVHFRHSARLLACAEVHQIPIALTLLPESRHAPREEATLRSVVQARIQFLLSHLGVDV